MFNDISDRYRKYGNCNAVAHGIINEQVHSEPWKEIHERQISALLAIVKYCPVDDYEYYSLSKYKKRPEPYAKSPEQDHVQIIARLSKIIEKQAVKINPIIPVLIFTPVAAGHVAETIE